MAQTMISDTGRTPVNRSLRIAIYLWLAGFSGLALGQQRLLGQTRQVQPAQNTAPRPTDKSSGKAVDGSAPIDPSKPGAYDPSSYVIGADDQLRISVWREPDLSLSVVVRPDGMITLPLLNDVGAAGLKPLELQSRLTERLKPFVNEPQVTVIVESIRSRKVFLAGAGIKAGSFPLGGRMTALELIVQGGGLGPFAKAKSIYVLRVVNGQQTRIPFNYKNALSGKSSSDVYLEPGDVVVVP
jgi:polysaccharide export outer membrane protein